MYVDFEISNRALFKLFRLVCKESLAVCGRAHLGDQDPTAMLYFFGNNQQAPANAHYT
jgi:hypothetical protein